MKNIIAKVISIAMIATALFGFASVFPIGAYWPQTGTPTVFVDPASNIFPPPSMTTGSTFRVNVTIANCSGIAGINFKLWWNPILLEAVSGSQQDVLFHAATPSAEWSNINPVKNTINNTEGSYLYGFTWYDIPTAISLGYAPANVTTAEYPPEGKIAIATILLRVKATGLPPPLGEVHCNLTLTDVVVGDPTPDQIPTENHNGYYQLNWVPPPLPYYMVEYANYTALNVGDQFNVSVKIVGMDPGWEAVGFEYKLGYNTTLLMPVAVYEGPWLPPFGALPNQGTSFMHFYGADYVQIGDVVMPDALGVWHAPFPAGTGVVGTITFQAIYQGVFPEPDAQCPLDLYDTIVADWHTNVINQSQAPIDSWYSIKSSFPVTGRVIDIFTAWPYPYGGQGPNQPSDMFWPQKEVCLYANVTYNGWPEQQKDVAFQIIAPNGFTWGVVYARTNADGIAKASFRFPWPCDNPEQWFGVWTVVGTVDIACIIVNDTLNFHYDYLVRIFKVTVDQPSYNHEPNVPYIINLNVTIGTYLWQDSIHYVDQDTNVTFDLDSFTVVVTGLDNTHVPFGTMSIQVPISALGTPWHYCEYRNITVYPWIPIPKFARAGPGEVIVGVLDDWPFYGGTVQSGYFDPDTLTWLPYASVPIIINAA